MSTLTQEVLLGLNDETSIIFHLRTLMSNLVANLWYKLQRHKIMHMYILPALLTFNDVAFSLFAR